MLVACAEVLPITLVHCHELKGLKLVYKYGLTVLKNVPTLLVAGKNVPTLVVSLEGTIIPALGPFK